ncbi:MAG: AAA family ATPase, partial [Candidatus Dormibacteria bacterium]
MLDSDQVLTAVADEPDVDRQLRPHRLGEFVGQVQVKEQLEILVQASRIRSEPVEHVLLCGPPGLGKTTLANIVA